MNMLPKLSQANAYISGLWFFKIVFLHSIYTELGQLFFVTESLVTKYADCCV
jgi:hypothetical protein